MGLGVATALVFLANYLTKNKAIVTIKNQSGYDLVGGQLRISSQPKEQEVGEIKDADSAKVQFEKFGDGHYEFTGQLRNGKAMRDSGGYLASGASYKDIIVIKARNDSLVAEFRQVVYK
jgi:transglutaminase-like putative cysteine protease